MNPAALMEAIVEEMNCPICMTFLREPVSINCGHTFCHSCLSGLWKLSGESQDLGYTCPLCRAPAQPRKLRPNWQLASVVDKVRLLGFCMEMGLQRDVCNLHKEQLAVFCKEDDVVTCKACHQSPEHEAHTVVPIKDVAWEYKWKLQETLELLRKEQEEAWKLEVGEKERAANWKTQMETRKQNILWEFEKYRQLLKEKDLPCQQVEEEAAAAQASLEQERRETANTLELRHNKIIQQSQALCRMIVELEERSQRPVRWMLQEQILEPAAARTNLLGAEDRLPCARTKRDLEDLCSRCAPRSRHSLRPPCRVQGQKKCALWRHPAAPA
ncbi:E3 ubiquitin-protein ligase TRIM68 isoform X2 [Onychomys torridus]|uniref:E3 ubiquitin-protein ligase TRIM68 isoform X2 n=1 Tax=Onychomys torridus TaxID=38674 RepID=UPI00167F3AD5|nr:E3 ubiquitin-protein ligase TRIM68 isoform X2 [Onychomys torridus]